jgi:mannosyl-oligosaccharide alpha-1,2-mannosidase
MYRITGDVKYQDMAWDMFHTIEKKTATEPGNAELVSVMQERPIKSDLMQSYWLAEGVKYAYLIFGDEQALSLDDWVLNTEAHPFKIPK